jgi:hypothetical protein
MAMIAEGGAWWIVGDVVTVGRISKASIACVVRGQKNKPKKK